MAIKPWEMQQLRVVIMQKELLVERLRAKLCGEKHAWVETGSEYFMLHEDTVEIRYTRICTKCEKKQTRQGEGLWRDLDE